MGYRGKVVEQEEARELRAVGLALNEIAAKLSVAKSSVSLWVRDVPVPPRPKGRPWTPDRKPSSLKVAKEAEIARLLEEGRRRIGHLSDREFLVAGAALYAGEGRKGDGAVQFANSDARMVAFFCRWLRTFFTIDESR